MAACVQSLMIPREESHIGQDASQGHCSVNGSAPWIDRRELPFDRSETSEELAALSRKSTEEPQHHAALDLGQVNARLAYEPGQRSKPPQRTGVQTPPRMTPTLNDEIAQEIGMHDILVRDGARVPFPASAIPEVMGNPGQYRDIISYWHVRPHPWKIQGHHLAMWNVFRREQRVVRRGGGFAPYVKSVKETLWLHGMDKEITLLEDPRRQDTLSTWLEYMAQQYTDQDYYTQDASQHQASQDEAWEELVAADLLRPYEDQAALSEDWPSNKDEQKIAALKIVLQSEESRFRAAETSGDEANIAHLRLKVEAVAKRLERALRRSELVAWYHDARRERQRSQAKADRLGIFLGWMHQQIPLIEQEMREKAETAANAMRTGYSDVGQSDSYRNPVWPESTSVFAPTGHTPDAVFRIRRLLGYFERSLHEDDVPFPTLRSIPGDDDDGGANGILDEQRQHQQKGKGIPEEAPTAEQMSPAPLTLDEDRIEQVQSTLTSSRRRSPCIPHEDEAAAPEHSAQNAPVGSDAGNGAGIVVSATGPVLTRSEDASPGHARQGDDVQVRNRGQAATASSTGSESVETGPLETPGGDGGRERWSYCCIQ